MCGIAGILTKDGTPPSEELLSRMSESLIHRGPDDEGMWIEGGVGLAHRRLAIIDLSKRGAQPMHSRNGRFVLVYNGEVYNYIELRRELEGLGATFQSDSDSEVVLESYRQWGRDAVKKFRGMFAFAVWDRQARTCFFARDRVGKKPFFYRTLSNGSFCFASELKALRLLESVLPDPHAIRLFFGMQYVPSPKTGFQDIYSLPPGFYGIADASGIRTEAYHSWNDFQETMTGDPAKDILTLLEEAVRLRLRADVTIGAMLSGGIDSAAIVGLAQRNLDRSIRTFTMGFPDIGTDERKEAREIAEFFQTDHQEFVAHPEDLIAMTEKLIFQYGGPYADSSALPVMMLSREIAKEIKVVLVGDGGDELFGGYRR
jgi:asparagine synthase (glutamine-hydrolysing)